MIKRQLISVIGIEIIDIDLFYHFINYYDPYVDEFSIVFNYQNSDFLESFYEMVPSNKRMNVKLWDGLYNEHTKSNHINNIINQENKSSIIADHDEFIEFNEDFFECPKDKYNTGSLIERFHLQDNKIVLRKVQRDESLFNQFEYKYNFGNFRAISKICYVHQNMNVSLGHHNLIEKKGIHCSTNVHHFKYDSFFPKVVENVLTNKFGFQHEIEKVNNFITTEKLSI
jgi:hypothetical protein